MARLGELQVADPGELGNQRSNEGDTNYCGDIPKEQREAFPRALAHKTSQCI